MPRKERGSVTDRVRRPTSTASFVQLQQTRWEWKLVGMKVKLPGTVWGIYAHNEETRAWARAHARQSFEVIVRNVVSAKRDKDPALGQAAASAATEDGDTKYLWIVQHSKEEPFTIRAQDLLPHVRGEQLKALMTLGAPVHVPSKNAPSAPCKNSSVQRLSKNNNAIGAVDNPKARHVVQGDPPASTVTSDRGAGTAAASDAGPGDANTASSTGGITGTYAQQEEHSGSENKLDSTGKPGQRPALGSDRAYEVAGVHTDDARNSDARGNKRRKRRRNGHLQDSQDSEPRSGKQIHRTAGAAASAQVMIQDASDDKISHFQHTVPGGNTNQATRKLLFALHIKVCDGVRLNLQVCEGDVPQDLARKIALQYNLGKGQEKFIAAAISKQAEAKPWLGPMAEIGAAEVAAVKDGMVSTSSTLSQFPTGTLAATHGNACKAQGPHPMHSIRLPGYSHDQGPDLNRISEQDAQKQRRSRRQRLDQDRNSRKTSTRKHDQSEPRASPAAKNEQNLCPVRQSSALCPPLFPPMRIVRSFV